MRKGEPVVVVLLFFVMLFFRLGLQIVLWIDAGIAGSLRYPGMSAGQFFLLLALIIFGGLIGALSVGAFLFLIHRKHGKEEKTGYSREYEQEPPYDYPPAYAGALLDDVSQKPSPKDFLATIFYLDKRGWLDIEKTLEGYKLVFNNKKEVLGIPSVRKVYEFLMDYSIRKKKGGKYELSFKELERRSLCDQEWFNKFFADWQKTVKKELREKKLVSGKGGLARFELVIVVYALIAGFFFVLLITPMNEVIFYFLVGFPFGFSFFGTTAAIALRSKYKDELMLKTREGQLHYNRWKSFRKFILEFSQMETHPPMHKELWDDIMTYSISLGIAREATEAMKISGTSESSLFKDGQMIHFNSKEMFKAIELFSAASTAALPIAAIGVAAVMMGGRK